MMIYRKIFALLFVVSVVFFGLYDASSAQNSSNRVKSKNPYLITNIFSSAEGASPSDSRAMAITKAHQIAFLVLLKNLNAPENIKDRVSDDQIAEAVYSRQMLDERIAGNYYSAKFNIAFLKSTVSSLIEESDFKVETKVSSREKRSNEKRILLFPVELVNGKQLLWENNNLWRKSLEETLNLSNIKNIIIPKGDYADIVNINLQNIDNAKSQDFASTLNRYGADKVIVAYFDLDKIENKANIRLNIIDDMNSKKARLGFVNSRNSSRSGLMLEVGERTINYVINNHEKESQELSSDTQGPVNKIKLNIEITDLEEWMMIKGKVERMNFVKDLKLETISRDAARVTLTHNANSSELFNLFASRGFLLRMASNGEYFLSAQ